MGVPVTVIEPQCVEPVPDVGEVVGDYVVRVSLAKSRAVAAPKDTPLLAADTVVVVDDTILGKPRDGAAAVAMLTRLSGRTHRVVTGVAIHFKGGAPPSGWECRDGHWVVAEETHVRFRELSPAEIDAYVSTGESDDKAGAYGIQGMGRAFVAGISGCYFNVVGLPTARVVDALIALENQHI